MEHVGIGLRQPHYAQILAEVPALGFVEVHSENFFADGGAALAVLREARTHYAVSLHGVGLALGSAAGLDAWHLNRLQRLVERIDPVRVSDHACFARASLGANGLMVHANDLLPIAFTDEMLAVMAANVTQVQERLRRSILVENLSSYVSFADDSMSEVEFFLQLSRRTGCSMLLDVNNLMVNALNAHAADAVDSCCAFVDALPEGLVGEIHLAGYADGGPIVIDDHGSHVRDDVWTVYAHAVRRFGALPTLVEWDTGIPPVEVLLGEASQAAGVIARTPRR